MRESTAVLLSHSHLNHSNDVNAVIDAMTYSGLDKKGVLIANKTSLNGADDYAPVVTPFHRSLMERFISVDRNQKIGINEIEIHTLTARHNEPNTIGFKIFAGDFILTYTSDTVAATDITEQYADSDVIIFNLPTQKKSANNLCADDVADIIKMIHPKAAIITHFSHDMIKADPLYEAREIQKATRAQVIAANDGMQMSLSGYNFAHIVTK